MSVEMEYEISEDYSFSVVDAEADPKEANLILCEIYRMAATDDRFDFTLITRDDDVLTVSKRTLNK